MVRIHPDPPAQESGVSRQWSVDPSRHGAVAQLGERLLCKQEVVGSIPSGSTRAGLGGLLSPDFSLGLMVGSDGAWSGAVRMVQ